MYTGLSSNWRSLETKRDLYTDISCSSWSMWLWSCSRLRITAEESEKKLCRPGTPARVYINYTTCTCTKVLHSLWEAKGWFQAFKWKGWTYIYRWQLMPVNVYIPWSDISIPWNTKLKMINIWWIFFTSTNLYETSKWTVFIHAIDAHILFTLYN